MVRNGDICISDELYPILTNINVLHPGFEASVCHEGFSHSAVGVDDHWQWKVRNVGFVGDVMNAEELQNAICDCDGFTFTY